MHEQDREPYRISADTTDEQLALCAMLDMWAEVTEGRLGLAETPVYALKVLSERRISTTSLQHYMRQARDISLQYPQANTDEQA